MLSDRSSAAPKVERRKRLERGGEESRRGVPGSSSVFSHSTVLPHAAKNPKFYSTIGGVVSTFHVLISLASSPRGVVRALAIPVAVVVCCTTRRVRSGLAPR